MIHAIQLVNVSQCIRPAGDTVTRIVSVYVCVQLNRACVYLCTCLRGYYRNMYDDVH